MEPSGGSLPQHLLLMQGGAGGEGEGLLPAIRTGRASADFSLGRKTSGGGGAKRRQENLDWARPSQPTRGGGGGAAGAGAGPLGAAGGEETVAAGGQWMARGMAAAGGVPLALDGVRRGDEEGGERMSLTPRDPAQDGEDEDEVICLGGQQQPETAKASIMRHPQVGAITDGDG